MRARILDKLALESISPVALRAYVIAEGWISVESFGQSSEVYVRQANGTNQELLIPFTTEIADYASSVGEVISFIASFEGRDELAIYSDLTRADHDVIRVRAPASDDDGSIEIDSGVGMFQHSRDALASAACSAIDPRRSYHLGKVQRAEEYMRRVKLGQTERGSFVVTLLAPVPPALSVPRQVSLWPEFQVEPFERQVTRVLAQALHSARSAVIASNRGDGLNAFNKVVQHGVSANLCEAVAAIVERAEGADFSVTWARTRPAPTARDTISFKKGDSEVLNEAARQFRLREPRHDERIIGFVTHLRRPEDRHEGHVRIKAIIDGRTRSLSADLSEADYQLAIEAHERQLPVTVLGDLEMGGQRWRLVEPRDLQVIEDDADDDEVADT